jgi:serine/threonine protein kinase/Flp pilus assembly protein TadD
MRCLYRGGGPCTSVKTQAQRVCSTCGASFPPGSNFCPACLLRGAIKNGLEVDDSEFDPIDLLSCRRLDHYEILLREDGKPFELGRGAMGITYKAIDVNLRCPVALKTIGARFIGDEAARQRFVREARAAASIRHPNVASVFHLGTFDDHYFYAMEFVAGESLDRLIRRSGRLDISSALTILQHVASGLEGIWRQNLIHRDIKPGNIIISTEDDRVVSAKIIDLGLSKGGTEAGAGSAVSAVGTFAGTAEYASPEQFAGLVCDIRSDLYSLGITFWEMLTGKLPFAGTASELMYLHQRGPLPLEKLNDLPQPAVSLLQLLSAKNPTERFQNPSQLLRAIPRAIAAIDSGQQTTPEQLRSAGSGPVASIRQPAAKLCHAKPGLLPAVNSRWAISAIAAILLLLSLLGFWAVRTGLLNPQSKSISYRDQSIAVLPFETLSANKEDSYFTDGIQGEILNNLARIAQLKVISRTSVMQYRAASHRDARQIAQSLGVTNLLEGTVRRNGNRIRVAAELIDATNDITIWADVYDRDLTDIFTIQSEVAQTIASKLNATLTVAEERSIAAKPTDNLKAYDLYLKAKLIIDRAVVDFDTNALQQPLHDAVDFLDEAVQLDPNFGLAYCAAAIAQDFLYLIYDHSSERRALGDVAISKALRLGRDLPEVRFTYAKHLFYAYRDYEGARMQLDIAKTNLPKDSRINALEADIDRHDGKFEKSIQEFNEALVRDPLNANLMSNLGLNYSFVRQYRASEQMFSRLIKLAPDLPMIKVQKACVVDFNERGDIAAVESALAELPTTLANDREVLSLQLAFAIAREEWQRAIELIDKFGGGDDEGEFGAGLSPVPVGCYSILIAALKRERATPAFLETREELHNRVQRSPGDGALLSALALVDALLGNKDIANQEAERALELLPVTENALDGPDVLRNVAAVHVWTGELDKAFTELTSLAKMPKGIAYGELKRDPYWQPLREDPRYEKILAELAQPTG